eukprot:g78462.t1
MGNSQASMIKQTWALVDKFLEDDDLAVENLHIIQMNITVLRLEDPEFEKHLGQLSKDKQTRLDILEKLMLRLRRQFGHYLHVPGNPKVMDPNCARCGLDPDCERCFLAARDCNSCDQIPAE